MKRIDQLKKEILLNHPEIKMYFAPFPYHDGKDMKSLSEVLETDVPQKYFLSEEQTQSLLRPKNFQNRLATVCGQTTQMDTLTKHILDS